MKKIANYIFIVTFVWLGFVLAISFMEAWVKFRAPSLTLAVGLEVGRLVFAALSTVEKVFLALQVLAAVFYIKKTGKLMALFMIAGILLVQWLWLLPALDDRALAIIANEALPPSRHHLYFVLAEAVKVILLVVLGLLQVKGCWRSRV